MPNPEGQALAQLGIALVDPQVAPAAYAELLRVARRIRESRRRAIGLLPASPRVAVPAVAIQLAAVLGEVCGGAVAFVDANTRWPALSKLGGDSLLDTDSLTRVQLCDGVVAFSRTHARPDRIDIAWLHDTLGTHTSGFVHVLVDLTGFPVMGEHALAFDIVDGVMVVARAGMTTERELLARHAEVPRSRILGVLLSG